MKTILIAFALFAAALLADDGGKPVTLTFKVMSVEKDGVIATEAKVHDPHEIRWEGHNRIVILCDSKGVAEDDQIVVDAISDGTGDFHGKHLRQYKLKPGAQLQLWDGNDFHLIGKPVNER